MINQIKLVGIGTDPTSFHRRSRFVALIFVVSIVGQQVEQT